MYRNPGPLVLGIALLLCLVSKKMTSYKGPFGDYLTHDSNYINIFSVLTIILRHDLFNTDEPYNKMRSMLKVT